jgi:hypothetical protein
MPFELDDIKNDRRIKISHDLATLEKDPKEFTQPESNA